MWRAGGSASYGFEGREGKKRNWVEKLTLDISQVNVVGGSIGIGAIITAVKLSLQTNACVQVWEDIYRERTWTLESDRARKGSPFVRCCGPAVFV